MRDRWRGVFASTVFCVQYLAVCGNPLEILDPQEEGTIHEDVTELRFVVNPELVSWHDERSADPGVLILLDGQQLATQKVNRNSCQHDCHFSVPVRGLQLGPHVFNLLLLERESSLSELDDDNILVETAVTFERIDRERPEQMEVGGAMVDVEEKHQSETDGAVRIEFLSPKGNLSSFLDPNNVHVRFRVRNFVIPAQGNAELEISGTVVAKDFETSEPSVALPSMTPRDYTASVFLTGLNGQRIGIHSTVVFHVWPDHSWVRSHVASGAGLSIARAGEAASFTITARDVHGQPQPRGGSWYVLRLEGPAVVTGKVTDRQDGTYEATFLAAEEGSYQLHVLLHYTDGAGLQDFGDENPQDVIGWHIRGSPFTLTVMPPSSPSALQGINPYGGVAACGIADLGLARDGEATAGGGGGGGRWVRVDVCASRGLDCAGGAQADDHMVWLPWRCRLPTVGASELRSWWAQAGQPRILIAGSSQQGGNAELMVESLVQRTLFFDVAKLLGSTQNQPRKYWTDLEATDVSPSLYFHWMVPEYDMEGDLDYSLLLEGLTEWLQKHLSKAEDLLIIQTSVHDIHLGSLREYPAHMATLADFLSRLPCRVLFRTGDALHIPPGGRHIIERGLRDPRMQAVNQAAAEAMAAESIPVLDSHSPSLARPDKTLDGYHYFDRHTEDLDAAGVEVCIGNSVARTLANLILHAVTTLE